MKVIHFLLPAATVAAGFIWLAGLSDRERSLGGQNVGLREQIAAVNETGTDPHAKTSRKPADGRAAWCKLADKMTRLLASEMTDRRAELEMGMRLERMTAAEVLASIDEIREMDFPAGGISSLLQQMLKTASAKDPEMTLRHFQDELADGGSVFSRYFESAFHQWMNGDPATMSCLLPFSEASVSVGTPLPANGPNWQRESRTRPGAKRS